MAGVARPRPGGKPLPTLWICHICFLSATLPLSTPQGHIPSPPRDWACHLCSGSCLIPIFSRNLNLHVAFSSVISLLAGPPSGPYPSAHRPAPGPAPGTPPLKQPSPSLPPPIFSGESPPPPPPPPPPIILSVTQPKWPPGKCSRERQGEQGACILLSSLCGSVLICLPWSQSAGHQTPCLITQMESQLLFHFGAQVEDTLDSRSGPKFQPV